METCLRLGVPVALERSRSGNGGHIWMFFDEPIPATLARGLASSIITETMEHRPDLGLDSYDRLVPGQDTMPKGGLGNLIALPLQKLSREQDNSVFLDERLVPFADQWAFLSTLGRIKRCQAEDIVSKAAAKGRVIGVRLSPSDEDDVTPWSAPPSRRHKDPPPSGLPEHLELVLGDQLYLAKDGLSPGLRNRLLRLAAFQNPEFYKAQAMRLPTFCKPRIIACAEDYPQHIALPRGCLEDVTELLSELKVRTTIAEGANRARSASEAFLFRRLETLALTAGRFRLNAELPIPFNGRGRMEVDLLDAASRVAIELDGGQHLTDRQAYRRDRRKDLLLQENGYFVLRFLAEDIGAHLEEVLDAIQHALIHRQRCLARPRLTGMGNPLRQVRPCL